MSATKKKILVIRDDNLGDLLLSLPSLDCLRRSIPSAKITLVAKRASSLVADQWLTDRRIEVVDASSYEVPPQYYDAAILLYSHSRWYRKLFNAGVPVRVGNVSKLPSILFLTHRIRQKRSLGLKSEADYCMELATTLLDHFQITPVLPGKTELPVDVRAKNAAEKVLSTKTLKPHSFWIFHPGMRGSAHNLSAESYASLIQSYQEKLKIPVLLSCGPTLEDRKICSEIRQILPSLESLENLSLTELAEVFRLAGGLTAPSTGPLHLAHAVGCPVNGLFTPVRSQQIRRWKPKYGTGTVRAESPDVECNATRRCLESRCREYPCMDSNNWAQAFDMSH